jgi:apolipoprotein N-acyltransferase
LSWIFRLHPLTWLGLSWFASIGITTLAWIIATCWGAGLSILWVIGLKQLSRFFSGGLTTIMTGATLWCLLEWLWGQSPLWWTALANSQSPHNLAIVQLSQLSGADGITLALLLVNGAIAQAWLQREGKLLAVAVGLGLSFHGFGWGLAQQPMTSDPANTLKIGLVQGNLPTRLKMSPVGLKPSVETYLEGYRTLATQNVDAVLLPEGAFPFLWGQSFSGEEFRVASAVRTAHVPLWAGVFVPTQDRYTQSLLSLLGDGSVAGQYNKVKLVPLGESLPFGPVLERVLHHLSPIQLGMVAGSPHQILETPFGQVIVGICYDSVFAELFRAQAAAGGQFILSMANNDPFGDRMMAQHHALDVLRAVETDRWLVRATNTGISAIIDPHGQTRWKSPINQAVSYVAIIERRNTQTLYVQFGNWLLPVMTLWSVGLGVANSRR